MLANMSKPPQHKTILAKPPLTHNRILRPLNPLRNLLNNILEERHRSVSSVQFSSLQQTKREREIAYTATQVLGTGITVL